MDCRFASDARKEGTRDGTLLESDFGGEAFPVSERHFSYSAYPQMLVY